MAKAGKKSTTTGTPEQRAIRQALRVAYEVDRYQWLCGNPMTPMPMIPASMPSTSPTVKPEPKSKPKGRPSYWRSSVRRELAKINTDGVSLAVITQKVVAALRDEIKQSGRSPPTRSLIGRELGRWRH